MSQFCSRCGAPLNEDGRCPNCDASYSVEGIFDQPQVFGSGYGSGSDIADTPDIAEEVDESSSDSGYDMGYTYMPYAEPEEEDPGSEEPGTDYAAPQVSDYGDTPSQESDYGYAVPQESDYGYTSSQPTDYAYTPSGAQGYNAAAPYASQTAPTQPSPAPASRQRSAAGLGDALKDWWDCAIAFFRNEPFDAADRVMKGGTSLWGIFAGLNVVFGAFCVAGMFGNGIQWLIEKVFGSYVLMMLNNNHDYTFGTMSGLFFFSLLMLAVLFCAAVGCGYALLSFNKKKPRVDKLIRLTAIAFFPMTVACAAAYIFSFFMIRLAGLLLLAGAIAGFHLFNEMVRREYGDLPFWHVVLCNVAQLVAGFLCVTVALAVI